jgi:hypothetical protein
MIMSSTTVMNGSTVTFSSLLRIQHFIGDDEKMLVVGGGGGGTRAIRLVDYVSQRSRERNVIQ